MPIADICHREPVTVSSDTSIADAAKLMGQHDAEVLVVAEERGGKRFPQGLLTDRDIVLRVIAEERDVRTTKACDVMTTDMLLVRAGNGIWDTLQHMRAQRARHVLVVDEGGALVGIASLEDLLDLLSEELLLLARLVSRETKAPASGAPG